MQVKRQEKYFQDLRVHARRGYTPLLALFVILSVLLSISLTSSAWLPHHASKDLAGVDGWVNDGEVTAPTFAFSPPPTQTIRVSPLFDNYYQDHSGAASLGAPLTVAFPTGHGWIQFFSSGALLLPDDKQEYSPGSKDILAGLISNGANDPDTKIVRLPLLQALLTAGSQVEIGGKGSSLTYVDMRKAANPALLLKATATPAATRDAGVFVKTGIRFGRDVGHRVPQAFWKYINRSDVSPDGWKVDFDVPRTEALAFTIKKNGKVHHMLAQAFGRDGLIMDQDTLDSTGQATIQRLSTGLDFLNTIGIPMVAIRVQQTVWAHSGSTLFDAPASGKVVAHVGRDFPLSLLGETNWDAGMLWYRVQWSAPKNVGTGWVPASSVNFTSPGDARGQASLDVLSPGLASYTARFGDNIGVAVYDLSRQRIYSYNGSAPFTMASSMKIPIMLAFFDMLETQGRAPDDGEMQLLTTMIENSDNDAASVLYYGELGGSSAMTSYLQKIGIAGLTTNEDAWGYSTITPLAMVDMLALLQQGKILTAQDRTIAFDLLQHIQTDQQAGVGDTAPPGAIASFKNGWVVGPDDLWVMNSSGLVSKGGITYAIAVYSQGQNTLDDGQAIVRHVCKNVADALLL